MNASPARALVLVLASLSAGAACACGYCVEDRIAAVYDHALSQRTKSLQHEIVFFAWDGPLERSEVARRRMLALAESTPGVDAGSTRLSMEPAAIAVAFDPRRRSVRDVTEALQRKLRVMPATITLLQAPKAQ